MSTSSSSQCPLCGGSNNLPTSPLVSSSSVKSWLLSVANAAQTGFRMMRRHGSKLSSMTRRKSVFKLKSHPLHKPVPFLFTRVAPTSSFDASHAVVLRRVEVSDAVVNAAGLLAESRALRGYDALHLASAVSLQNRVPVSVSFMAFDRQLMTAAKLEGLSSVVDL